MPRRGVTLVELVAVVGTIGVIILMLLPALLRAGELARQIECQNNQKQVALGLLNYHHEFECFPPGAYESLGTDGRPVGRGLSWSIALLPHVEQANVYSSLFRDMPVSAPENLTFRVTSMRTFLCPSSLPHAEARSHPLLLGTGVGMVQLARSSYVASFGTGDPLDSANPSSNGMFMTGRCVRLEDVFDGTSSTFLLGERSPESGPASWVGVVGATGPALIFGTTAGDPGPNARPPRVTGFSSRHPGGAYFAFGDGSVRFVSNGVGATVYHALATRAGGEIISDDGE